MYRSGLNSLDRALAGGTGIPDGSIVQIYGAPDSAKTALALWFCRTRLTDPEATCGWVPTEAPLDPASLQWAGIDPNRFFIARQSNDWNGLELAERFLEAEASLVVIDSLAALVEDERRLDEILSRGLPRLKCQVLRRKNLLVLCNQERIVQGTRRVPPEVQPAGQSVALLAAVDYNVRLWIGEGLYRAGEQVGHRVHYRVYRNGGFPAGQLGRFNVYWDTERIGLRDLMGALPFDS